MAANENSKDLLSVLWAGADILRGNMDANEYKNYLLGIVFYKYLSDTFLTRVYDLLYNKKPDTMADAQAAYEEVFSTEDAEELLEDIKESYRYTIEPELTYTKLAEAAGKNAFQREMLKKHSIGLSNPIPYLQTCLPMLISIPQDLAQVSRSSPHWSQNLSRR